MNESSVDLLLKKSNEKLRSLCTGIQIERRKTRLSLRGVFPPRPGSKNTVRHQQRIPLGLPASKDGIEEAENEAMSVARSIKSKSFDWDKYITTVKSVESGLVTFNRWYKEFELYVLAKENGKGSQMSASTWSSSYRPYLASLKSTLEQNPSLTMVDGMYKVLKTYNEHSRSREICCSVFSSLASFLTLDMPQPLKLMRGKYQKSRANIRIPNDQEILEYWEKIPNQQWRFVYGMIATYGLRNYEPFFSELPNNDGVIYTENPLVMHYREVWPFMPQWVETFSLRECQLPSISTDINSTTLQSIGQRVTRQFKRYDIPFSPVSLRLAWIARLIKEGLPESILAKLLGSSNFKARNFIQCHMETSYDL